MTALNHKAMAAHFRKRLKANKIKARCQMSSSCGEDLIHVFVPSYDSQFTAEEIRSIVSMAKVNGMTGCQGSELDPDHEAHLTGKMQWSFHMPRTA